MKYPLEFLLGLRKTRMEKCEQALAQARALVRKRNKELEDRTREHREYVEWCDREEDRIFEELIKKPSTHHKVLESREEMLANRAKEAEYLHRIEEARAALKAAQPVIDTMVNKGIIHKNAAARYKSRLAAGVKGKAAK